MPTANEPLPEAPGITGTAKLPISLHERLAALSAPDLAAIEAEIVSDKTLRRDIDGILQRVKEMGPTRERSLCVTKLQEAVMWLGMDLKRLNESRGSAPPKTAAECAKAAYQRYGAVTGNRNFRGDPMPDWEALGETIQRAWMAAITIPDTTNPYPSSKDPSTGGKVEPTADGLKL